jgi:hypothetical protein
MKVSPKRIHARKDEFEARERGTFVSIGIYRHMVIVDVETPTLGLIRRELALSELAALLATSEE